MGASGSFLPPCFLFGEDFDNLFAMDKVEPSSKIGAGTRCQCTCVGESELDFRPISKGALTYMMDSLSIACE